MAQRAFRPLIGRYERLLEQELAGCASVLDIGCGSCSPLAALARRPSYSVGLDTYAPDLRVSKRSGIHDDYVVMQALDAARAFRPRSFDAVVALDVIEHLPKRDGYRLLTMMEDLARKRVVIMTPNGFLPQSPDDGNPYQEHVSGWSYEEMRRLGFRVAGINGWKPLRGERTRIRWRPAILWESTSRASEVVTIRQPRFAFQLLCVKVLE